MKRATIAGGAVVVVLLLAVAAGYRFLRHHPHLAEPTPATAPRAIAPSAPTASGPAPPAETYQGFLYGRVTTVKKVTYEGRLRFGAGGQEAFWSNDFNGAKRENPWVADVPPGRLPTATIATRILGIKISEKRGPIDVRRPFLVRFGELVRIDAHGRDVVATLKSGTVLDLDRFGASDFDDGVRVWDAKHGVVDLDSVQVRTIELLATPPLAGLPQRLHGTVHTRQGDFTGFIGWNRENYLGTDELDGRADAGDVSLRFDTIRSIARRSEESSLMTLRDGREVVVSDTQEAGDGFRGLFVDDRRFGRVMISWDAFERVDFTPGGSGPAYGDFPPGRPLMASVATRDGRHLAGRLVYDLDESETTDTLDAESQGIDYTIPFALIASVVPLAPGAGGLHRATITLHSGEELQLEGSADVGRSHAGLLIFTPGRERPEYVRWEELQQIDIDRPPAISPPIL